VFQRLFDFEFDVAFVLLRMVITPRMLPQLPALHSQGTACTNRAQEKEKNCASRGRTASGPKSDGRVLCCHRWS